MRRRVTIGVCALVLMLSASPGLEPASVVLAQQEQPLPPPNQILAPHESIRQLGVEVASLTDLQILNKGQGRSLTTKLDRASNGLMGGDPNGALRPLNAFGNEVAALTRARVLGDQEALLLNGLTAQAVTGIRDAETVPFVAPLNPCLTSDPCSPPVFWVDRRARSGGNGSEDRPFRRIVEALSAAQEAEACGVEVVVRAGTYRETFELSRDTELRAAGSARPVIEGSVRNYGGHDLSVSGITFEGSPAPAAILVDGPCGSSTEITDVVIRDAAHHGVYQHRGALRAVALEIRDTGVDPTDATTGTALRLASGVQAAIGLSTLWFNDGGGLYAEGLGTRVHLALSTVSHNNVYPKDYATSDFAASGIEVADGALLLASFNTLVGNEFGGLMVRDGARAHFRYGRIEHSGDFVNAAGKTIGGANAQALTGATLQLSHFRLNHGDLIGLFFKAAYARAEEGVVAHNIFGTGVFELPPDYPFTLLDACLGNEVRYVANTRTFVGDALPTECPVGTPCPPCPFEVPFVCTWCS